MFWKIALFLGVFGIILGFIILIVSIVALSSVTTDENTKDIAVYGFLGGIILIIFSFLLAALSLIFVLRSSKREFDAKKSQQ